MMNQFCCLLRITVRGHWMLLTAAMLSLGIVFLLRLNPSLAIYAAIALPFYAVVCAVFLPRIKRNTNDIRLRWAELIAYGLERISNIITVKKLCKRAVGSR
jgi:ABC-type bacteriocin/lantibiotic exporter with double-glycine peptidase domain